ncbi:MAG: indolepyruvate oxidoreductase subunit beta [Desulfobacterales bacterium]|nr:MAG: indolepyruvate oxidoreductase subunit beta [Desulfobacterales bacterium]
MTNQVLAADPYNLIITGVGGQGNVLASKLVGNMLSDKGYYVTIGETFGASQRGGSVMSHLRISSESILSPQIPKGKAHIVVALEPTEALRVLQQYGNPEVKVITNTRPVYSVGVICGEFNYPSGDDLHRWLEKLTQACWFIDATAEAVKLGNPILGNVLLVGALAGVADLPLDRDGFREVMARTMPPDRVEVNVRAFDKGLAMIK